MASPESSGIKFRSAFLHNLILSPTSSARFNLKISERSKPVVPATLLLSLPTSHSRSPAQSRILSERDSRIFCKRASNTTKEHLQEERLGLLKETTRRNKLRDLADEIRKFPEKDVKEILGCVVKNGENQTLSDFNNFLSVLITLDEKDLAFELYSYLPSYGLIPDCRTFSLMIRCHCKRNELDEAKQILDDMLERGYHPSVTTFTILIALLCKNGKLHKAFEVFDAMGKIRCEATIRIYNCLLKGLCYVGRVEEAFEMLETIKKKRLVTPDVYTYTAVMDGFCKVGRSDEAKELLDEAKEMGLEPGAITYNTLFDGYCREGRPMKGLSLLKLMKQRNIVPDSITFNTFLNGLLRWGKIQEALTVHKEMERISLEADERIMGCLFRGLCRKSWEEPDLVYDARQMFDKMTRRKFSAVSHPSTYSLLIRALCARRRFDEALRCLDRAIEFGLVPRTVTFNNLIQGLSREGRIEEALTVVLVIYGHGKIPSRTSYDVLINELNRQGRLPTAGTVYGRALKQRVFPRQQPQCCSQTKL